MRRAYPETLPVAFDPVSLHSPQLAAVLPSQSTSGLSPGTLGCIWCWGSSLALYKFQSQSSLVSIKHDSEP